MSEAYVPTQHSQASQEARLPASDVDPRRARRPERAPGQGPRSAVRLIWRVERRETFLALRAARRSRSGPLTVSWIPGEPTVPARVAFAVGRKVGPAVERNRVRRRLRALIRETPTTVPAGAYLIGVAPGATRLSYAELGVALDEALDKVAALASRSSREVPA
jgi:ribonuclease P protein component